jgi:hypothetical protein
MRRYLTSLLLAATLVSPVIFSGCAAHVQYYDADHHDYHHWDNNEVVYYQRWEVETHRNHVDFAKRNDDEKKEYWNWRHSH